jgi:hypothetical protein
MKTRTFFLAAILLSGAWADAQPTTAFTFQGQLNSGAAAATGLFDFQFTLFDNATNGAVIAGPLTNAAIAVTNAFFTAQVDFGAGAFSGPPRWLQVGVRTNGSSEAFENLAPLQLVTAVPYSVTAINLSGPLATTNLSGSLSLSQLPSAVVTNGAGGLTLGGAFTGDGSGLGGLNASALSSGSVGLARLPIGGLNGLVLDGAASLNLGGSFSGSFSGDGSGLSGLNAGGLTGFVPPSVLNAVPAASLTGTVPGGALAGVYPNALTFSSALNTINGNGAGLTSLNASQLTTGTIPLTALPGGLAGTLFASGTEISNLLAVNNLTNVNLIGPTTNTGGFWLEDGALFVTNTTSEAIVTVRASSVTITNGPNSGLGVVLSNGVVIASGDIDSGGNANIGGNITTTGGTFTGNGNGLTSLNASQLAGTIPQGAIPTPYTSPVSFNNPLADTFTGSAVNATTITAGLGGINDSGALSANGITDNGATTTVNNLVVVGNLYLPAPTSTGGIIYSGSNMLIHSGGQNFFAGEMSGNLTLNSSQDTGIGVGTLSVEVSGGVNTAVGAYALNNNTSGFGNTAAGDEALFSNTGGSGNTADGWSALYQNTTGKYNTASGTEALADNTTGDGNTATGIGALLGNSTGNDNTATGDAALQSNTTGDGNTANGPRALAVNTTGSYNIADGYQAGYLITTGSSNIDIGNVGSASDDNIIRIGSSQTQAFIAGTITGNGAGLTGLLSAAGNPVIDITAVATNYAFDTSATLQTDTGAGTAPTQIAVELSGTNNGWSVQTGGGFTTFAAAQSGLYRVDYQATLATAATGGGTQIAIAAQTNNVAVPGSGIATVVTAGGVNTVSKSFLVYYAVGGAAPTTSLTFAFTSSSGNGELLSGSLNGLISYPSFSVTIQRASP